MKKEISNNDLLGAIHELSQHNDIKRNDLRDELVTANRDLRDELVTANRDLRDEILGAMYAFAEQVDARFNKIDAVMATKDYVDRKFWELKSDMGAMMKLHVKAMH